MTPIQTKPEASLYDGSLRGLNVTFVIGSPNVTNLQAKDTSSPLPTKWIRKEDICYKCDGKGQFPPKEKRRWINGEYRDNKPVLCTDCSNGAGSHPVPKDPAMRPTPIHIQLTDRNGLRPTRNR